MSNTPAGRSFWRASFTAILEKDDDWYVAYCPEMLGANGQGRTKEEACASLAAAIDLVFRDRQEDALRGLPWIISRTVAHRRSLKKGEARS